MYFKREIKSSKIGTKFIPALKYGAFFGFSRKKIKKMNEKKKTNLKFEI